MDQLFVTLMSELLHQTGLLDLTLGNLVMITAGCVLLYLGIIKKYEPFLLVGIGFSCIVANVPGSTLTAPGGLFYFAYQGVEQLILPPLIFLGVGAMTDFGPMIANPSLVILGAAAHLGIFVALIPSGRSSLDRYHRRCGWSDGDLHHDEAGAASPAADFCRSLLLHGSHAAHSAADHEAPHE